jgi:L-asparagine transporter-like permease
MQAIDPVVWKETKYIALWGLILSAVMQAVFLIIGEWDYTVLLGNLLGYAAIVLNYFGIGLTVQKALEKDEKDAKQTMKLSNTVRMLFLFVVVVIGVAVECFHMWAVLIPLLFPRIAIALRMLQKKKTEGEDQAHEE